MVDGWHLQEPQNRCTALEPGEEATEGMTLIGSLIYIGTDPMSPHHLSPMSIHQAIMLHVFNTCTYGETNSQLLLM